MQHDLVITGSHVPSFKCIGHCFCIAANFDHSWCAWIIVYIGRCSHSNSNNSSSIWQSIINTVSRCRPRSRPLSLMSTYPRRMFVSVVANRACIHESFTFNLWYVFRSVLCVARCAVLLVRKIRCDRGLWENGNNIILQHQRRGIVIVISVHLSVCLSVGYLKKIINGFVRNFLEGWPGGIGIRENRLDFWLRSGFFRGSWIIFRILHHVRYRCCNLSNVYELIYATEIAQASSNSLKSAKVGYMRSTDWHRVPCSLLCYANPPPRRKHIFPLYQVIRHIFR